MKKLLKALTGRLTISCFLIFIQLLLLLISIIVFATRFIYFYLIMLLFSLALVIAIVNDDSNPTFKMAWIIPMLIFPIFGAPLYIIFGRKTVAKRIKKQLDEHFESVNKILPDNGQIMDELKKDDIYVYKQFKYISKTSLSNPSKNTSTKFLPTGELFYEHLLIELEKAEKFIFLEYFIIAKGTMWNCVLEILKRKVAAGVDVRIIYDDFGTISLLDKDYKKYLESLGMKCSIFNPFHPSLDSFLNYRDHRKIAIIDGNVGFTGGINLADEYINAITRFGHWKDSSVMIKGDAVTRLTVMFLQIWYFLNTEVENIYQPYFNTKAYPSDGYVLPFSDSPISGHLTGELAYMNMINNAKRYVYITTPYLILDNEMITAIRLAVESGVDVRIITPHIPDKWYVHAVSQANYPYLLKSGVRIYEYTPGFIHAKTIVVDDELAIVGTTNFDFRSFYLHFENGILMYKSSCVNEVRDEFKTILSLSEEITYEQYMKEPKFHRFSMKVLKLFSPMM